MAIDDVARERLKAKMSSPWISSRDDAAREQLKADLAALDTAIGELHAAIDAISEVREGLLERHGVLIAGECESCSRLMFVGEKGLRDEDRGVLCEACAPTWEEALRQWDSGNAADAGAVEFRAALDAHLAAGGSLGDKMVLWEL